MKFLLISQLKDDIADRAGEVVCKTLQDIGYSEVTGVRIGKTVELEMDASDESSAKKRIESMASELLASEGLEKFSIIKIS